MLKKTSSKSAVTASVISLVLCFAMLIGTTFAWFTASTSTIVNTIKSGELKIDLVDENDETVVGKTLNFVDAEGNVIDDALWEPNCSYTVEDVYVKNTGNVDLKFKIDVIGISGDEGLADVITWSVDGVNIEGTTYSLAAGETYSTAIALTGTMDKDAGNQYMNKTADGIAIAVYATQDDDEAEFEEVVGLIKALDVDEITDVDLDTAYTFTTTDDAPEAKYADWNADYVISFNQAVAANTVTLAGSYAAYNDGQWLSFNNPELAEGEEFRLLANFNGGTYITYEEVCNNVGTFNCGAASDVDGLVMTVELRLYERSGSTETGNYVTAGIYTYAF
jgi:predicted ribosomally synthesized peptide with SipW-like signal peptide